MGVLTSSVTQPVWGEKRKVTSASSANTSGIFSPPCWALTPKLTSHVPFRAALYSYSPAGKGNVPSHN